MRALRVLFAPAALLLGLACQPRTDPPIYGPWEEGLTLAFEDPSQPQPQRSANRLQVRVARSAMAPGSPRLVQLDLASTRGQLSLLLRHQDGGIALVGEDGQVLAHSLPSRFPDTAPWVERGTAFRVIGRARWEGAAILPPTSDAIGVWVEARSPHGRRRTLYLPGLGEVEAQEERDGTWVAVNRLVARGFTDLPILKRP
ncbi:MAG: hypothetical protein Q8K67_14005 [Geothrix sp.]|nr:hypothetical protein [Geothrix sp.]